jgi:DNA-binding PadR family transcriptional regulator
MAHFQSLTSPSHLYTRAEVLSKPCPVPSASGVYAWFFKEIPGIVPTDGCVTKDRLTLLYVGISPKNESSSQDIRKRIKTHYSGNAAGSTLRLTLGVLLEGKSGFPLRRVGSGKKKDRFTLTHLGEQWLDAWMQENALVCWIEHPDPCAMEKEILQALSLPLNLQDNQAHPFWAELSDLRKEAKRSARGEPIADETGQQRSGN